MIELKAVDSAYPLVGTVVLDPQAPLAAALAGGLVADLLVLDRLRLHPGDTVRLGEASFVLRAALKTEPDHATGIALLGPRVMIGLADLPRTGLIQPGSLLTYVDRVVLPPGTDTDAFIDQIREAFPNTGWRIRDTSEAAPGMENAIEQTSLFLTLVGLCALLVGGIGVATGVRAPGWRRAPAPSPHCAALGASVRPDLRRVR